jgi:putative transposase
VYGVKRKSAKAEKCDKTAAQRRFEKLIDRNGEPETTTIDKSGSNLASLEALNTQRDTPIRIGQNKYLNNIIDQGHRAIKRRVRPMLQFKTPRCARNLLGGIEAMHMIKKGQMKELKKLPPSVLPASPISISDHMVFVRHTLLIATKPVRLR